MTTATTRLRTLADLRPLVGETLGTSDWVTVDQDRIGLFADATDDHQWIHVDVERATKEGPFGRPIAHGYLTLSLIAGLWQQIFSVDSVTAIVNYGLNKVRFTNPVPAGRRVRLVATLADLTDVNGGVQLTFSGVVELEGSDRPAVVADVVFRLYESKDGR